LHALAAGGDVGDGAAVGLIQAAVMGVDVGCGEGAGAAERAPGGVSDGDFDAQRGQVDGQVVARPGGGVVVAVVAL
jgi:hypothetical protein